MLFNTLDFGIFLSLVFALYWTLGRGKVHVQNYILLLASYFFYGYWDWWFLSLLFISSATDFWVGIKLNQTDSDKHRKFLLSLSVFVNLGLLFSFKYFNFFIGSFIEKFSFAGFIFTRNDVSFILPIGISFYTLQTLSYTIDVYKRRITPTHNWVEFFTYVSFFPQILLGLFKKIVIADACGRQVDLIFSDYQNLDGSTLLLGAIYFLFQVYGDFSGYSDMAIGMGRLFGINLSQNFNYPFLSQNPRELWQRWHISLTTWFRDYVYIPLGGNRKSEFRTQLNILIVFLLSGLWHGAYWTFIVWGAIHGLVLLADRNLSHLKSYLGKKSRLEIPSFSALSFLLTLTVFTYFSLSSVFFRSATIPEALHYFSRMFGPGLFSIPQYYSKLFILIPFTFFEWYQRNKTHALEISHWKKWQRWLVYYIFMAFISYYFTTDRPYIYFQF